VVVFSVWVGFYICMFTLMYFFGRNKRNYEKEMIQSKLKELEKMAKGEKKVQL
jgi:hypothetical protein